MKQLFGLMVVTALAVVPAGAQEAFELASLQTPGTGALVTGGEDSGRALIKEEDCVSPEATALIERNREDVERTVVMDQ